MPLAGAPWGHRAIERSARQPEGLREMTETPRIRTSDAERERVAEQLRAAVGEGRLTLEEGDERLATLYTTKFRDELGPLVADLPNPAGEARRGRHGWGPA